MTVCTPDIFLKAYSTRYSDLDYKLRKDSSGNVIIHENNKAIDQSIKTILSTYPGERIMLPEFGSRFKELLFDPMDEDTIDNMEYEIKEALDRWEPRISVDEVTIEEDLNKQTYNILIGYTILETGNIVTFTGVVKAYG